MDMSLAEQMEWIRVSVRFGVRVRVRVSFRARASVRVGIKG